MDKILKLKGNFAIFYMLAKYVPGDIKYIFTKYTLHNKKYLIGLGSKLQELILIPIHIQAKFEIWHQISTK
jgi:hypothetical protein